MLLQLRFGEIGGQRSGVSLGGDSGSQLGSPGVTGGLLMPAGDGAGL